MNGYMLIVVMKIISPTPFGDSLQDITEGYPPVATLAQCESNAVTRESALHHEQLKFGGRILNFSTNCVQVVDGKPVETKRTF